MVVGVLVTPHFAGKSGVGAVYQTLIMLEKLAPSLWMSERRCISREL